MTSPITTRIGAAECNEGHVLSVRRLRRRLPQRPNLTTGTVSHDGHLITSAWPCPPTTASLHDPCLLVTRGASPPTAVAQCTLRRGRRRWQAGQPGNGPPSNSRREPSAGGTTAAPAADGSPEQRAAGIVIVFGSNSRHHSCQARPFHGRAVSIVMLWRAITVPENYASSESRRARTCQ